MLQPTLENINQLFEHAITTGPADTGGVWQIENYREICGGDTHAGYLLRSNDRGFFLKLNSRSHHHLFKAEIESLKAIENTHTIATCHPLCSGYCQSYSYLLLDELHLTSDGDWRLAGQQLAQMHKASTPGYYGFDAPSYCGFTFQPHNHCDNWAEFFATRRIGHQLSMFYGQGIESKQISPYVEVIRARLAGHQPRAALVHGDLWQGNIGFHKDSPVIYDPACYYGDPETDLAMTELFGRLPEDFYRGYHQIAPIDQHYPERRSIYQLYHLLNHANLFGGEYRTQAEQALKRLAH
ncbi:MAG: fructosamine kinase family protein [Cellvibrionaceae bacterium]|nr:fructosamine kinase family protein [Cellvibrionaceae bacterium]|tara:strand:+ start:4266 stop:5153 length:888 start_codon:yes stop_codon:yes gene_type:complete